MSEKNSTKSAEEITAEVMRILQENTSVEAIDPNAHIVNDLKADSLTVAEIVLALEEHFDISITDEEAEKITTLSEAVSFVKSALEKKDS